MSGGLLLGMVGGIPVACGNYIQQWALQAPNNPSNLRGTKSGLFLKRMFLGLMIAVGLLLCLVGGISVACGKYAQQWALRASNPSNMLGAKSGLFLKSKLFFGLDDWWGFCLAWWVESL